MRSIFREVFVNTLAASKLVPGTLRYVLYRMYGLDVRTRGIYPNNYFGGKNVSVGRNTLINNRCFFDTNANIEIGENCSIAMDVFFCTSTPEFKPSTKRPRQVYGKPIRVGNGVSIGACSSIFPGVAIGDGCIIAAGSVVDSDCEPNCLYAGVPAKKIKELDQ